jgi:HSP20 family molecular chaperone IbpA
MTGMPTPKNEVYEVGEQLFRQLEHIHDLLADPELTTVRIVLNLERMVIREAQRSFTSFHLYGYPTDLVVCNRVLPEDAGPYFGAWREAQNRYRPMVDESFAPVPVRDAPFFDEEVVGERMLRSLGAAVFGDTDPTEFFYRGRPYTVRRDGDRYVLELELPFTSREEVKLSRYGDELAITSGRGGGTSSCRGFSSTRRRSAAGSGTTRCASSSRRQAPSRQGRRERAEPWSSRNARRSLPCAWPRSRRAWPRWKPGRRMPKLRAGAGPMAAIDALMDKLLPAEVRTHLRAARKEQLLAIRSMVDIWIERVDRKPEERRRPRHESISLDEA